MDRPRAVLAARQAVRGALESRTVLVACSGGSDSLALALALSAEAQSAGVSPRAITVDHGLLPGSDTRARDLVERLSALMPARAVRIDAAGTEGPEGSARTGRYAAIADEARRLGGPALVLLGHTMDDQAETVLMGLGRGSGPRSIAGMRPTGYLPGTTDVPFARPFLNLTRSELRQACTEWGWQWWDDPSNSSEGPWRTADGGPLRRSAVRDRALPELSRALGQDVRGALARTAGLLQEDLDCLDDLAHTALGEALDGEVLLLASLRPHHRAIRTRIIRSWLLAQGARAGELTAWHVNAVDRLVEGETGKRIDVPGLRVRRTRDRLERHVE
ncbi:tRNA lysidine(34) synthetase TilS [Flaviflexus equikiangi]|uniref:tRNA(Ile)-lysidine synthase n=1 Tax=Flaviflexus equikiangi TaxID=2758573 RepID=A0ABS2TG50_9ACTO|nr:tRNA lysidine(34) synthetase TilS [Flaviflexus equikiangi]MBM9433630.1 tRNA lysidine(34) synthetase TilS [Flaviflexus equikiangi]